MVNRRTILRIYNFLDRSNIIMFCVNCGKQIPDGSKFCPHCGEDLKDGSNLIY